MLPVFNYIILIYLVCSWCLQVGIPYITKNSLSLPLHIPSQFGKKKTNRQTTLTVQINVMTNAMSQTWKEGSSADCDGE